MKNISRKDLVMKLSGESQWDIVIIGGGATGLGVALDSISRGYSTLLVEQEDFSKGTSSRSTKLVHGGVRYLAQGNIDLVREALFERGVMARNAPHLVSKQTFIIPGYSIWNNYFYTIGLKFYDFLSGRLSFGKSRRIGRSDTLARLETIASKDLYGGVEYFDGQFDDSRFAINIAQSCLENGATLLNYFKAVDLLKDENGSIDGLIVRDEETGKSYNISTKVVINASGVFTDEVMQIDNKAAPDMVRPSQGVHLVIDKSFLPGSDAIMIPKTDDGRVLFLVPWHEKVVMGTTDTLIDSHSLEPVALEKEIDFILDTANRYLKKRVGKRDVLSVYAGLRPLAASKSKSEKTKEISRSHKIIVSDSGLVSIIGGKWTTYRKMALDAISKVIALGKLESRECVTENLSIHGATISPVEDSHLKIYGSDQADIIKLSKDNALLSEKIHKDFPFLKAEVIWSARYEMARTVEDILARRIRLLFLDARAAVESASTVAELLAQELGKDNLWKLDQITKFENLASNYIINE